ncbi:uncharacterized protein LOC126904254 isoform X2 [Daktulosphaira vitifoliae]|uniref:uncharacterized protein LOC126904254 isoform X2 n=1 Tax=Daktulosphaira vitifoliae TaxID=58002 RepID=UPI0021A9BE8C|nr:uncharacterized protein LOC126904254 isoform X2 [Daktulosphaira vitifoliae]
MKNAMSNVNFALGNGIRCVPPLSPIVRSGTGVIFGQPDVYVSYCDSMLGISSTTYGCVLKNSTMVEVFAASQGDCNSNNLEMLDTTLSSYRSNASSQDNADFFQDYSDYQWFADYRYRDPDNLNHHQSILTSISENYNVPCYEDVARDLDVNLAHVDMENLKSEDIHNILSTLPSMCGQDIQAISTDSFCKNKQLFSPVKEQSPNPFITFSTDSLDCSDDMLITCKANNKHNYTIAFEEPAMGVSEEFQSSEAMSTGESRNTGSGEAWSSDGSIQPSIPMVSSDTTFTTWNKLKKCITSETKNCIQLNNETSSSLSSTNNEKTQSLPDLIPLKLIWLKQKKSHYNYLIKSTQSEGGNDCRAAKLFDLSGTKEQTNSTKFSLVKMFISQKKNRQSDSSLVISENEVIADTSDTCKNNLEDSLMCQNKNTVNSKCISNNNGSINSSIMTNKHLWKGSSINKSMQTSSMDNSINISSDTKCASSPVYVMFPSYTLPDLSFLKNPKASVDITNVFLIPQKFSPLPSPEVEFKKLTTTSIKEHCSSIENSFDLKSLCAKGFDHVNDWNSLAILLPHNVSTALSKTPELKECFKNINLKLVEPSFCQSEIKSTNKKDNMYIYQYDDSNQNHKPPAGRMNSKIPIKNELRRPLGEVPKRLSMNDMKPETLNEYQNKRRSLPSQLIVDLNIPTMSSDVGTSEDEGVECSGSNCDSPNPYVDEAKRLDSILRQNKKSQVNLRSQMNKYLHRAGHHTPPNSPNQATIQIKKGLDSDKFEEYEINKPTDSISHKKDLIRNCCFAAEKIAFCLDNDHTDDLHSVVLDVFCPALYALFSENLKTMLETSFGPVQSSVWHVIEASSQQGILSSALNELTLKINNELALNEGVMKFNAFVFGLLNVGGLDAWLCYIRTRESVLQKFYNRNALFVRANFGCTLHRDLVDRLITATKSLSKYRPDLDPLFECRKLHESLSNINNRTSWLLKKTARTLENETSRPRSYVDSARTVDVASTASKRWSGVHMGSKLATAFERLENIDERTRMEVENNCDQEKPVQRNRFRRLQMKWELLSTKDLTVNTPDFESPISDGLNSRRLSKSRIPRPVLSPIQPPQDSFSNRRPVSSNCKEEVPNLISPGTTKTDPSINKSKKPSTSINKVVRPSSLPQRKPKELVRYVRTLSHRLSADNGHLSFNEGEKLQLVLEVDDKWILCCRGARKGLVPRSLVLIVSK